MRFGLRMRNSEELRIARDGGAYTWKEFQKHYSKKVALKRWQEASPVANSASQPAEEVRCASDALAVVEKLVEKPSDARSCGDAFAPPQGCQALVEKPSDIDSDADMIIFKKACGVLLVFPFPCRRVVCHWCESRSDGDCDMCGRPCCIMHSMVCEDCDHFFCVPSEDMGCLWRHICPY